MQSETFLIKEETLQPEERSTLSERKCLLDLQERDMVRTSNEDISTFECKTSLFEFSLYWNTISMRISNKME